MEENKLRYLVDSIYLRIYVCMRSPHVNLLLLVLPENGRHVETARTNYGGGTPPQPKKVALFT